MAAVLLGVEERVLQAEGKVSSRLSGLGRASECLRDKPAHILVVDKAFGRSPPRQTDGRTDRQTDRQGHSPRAAVVRCVLVLVDNGSRRTGCGQ